MNIFKNLCCSHRQSMAHTHTTTRPSPCYKTHPVRCRPPATRIAQNHMLPFAPFDAVTVRVLFFDTDVGGAQTPPFPQNGQFFHQDGDQGGGGGARGPTHEARCLGAGASCVRHCAGGYRGDTRRATTRSDTLATSNPLSFLANAFSDILTSK